MEFDYSFSEEELEDFESQITPESIIESIRAAAITIAYVKEFAYKYGIVIGELDKNKWSITPDSLELEFGKDWIYANYEVYIGCNEYERQSFKFPTTFLSDPEWSLKAQDELIERKEFEEMQRQAAERERKLQAAIAAKKKAEEDAKKAEIEREEKDRKDFERLTLKYAPTKENLEKAYQDGYDDWNRRGDQARNSYSNTNKLLVEKWIEGFDRAQHDAYTQSEGG
jgi:type IV secretory pathway VirB10-like protein